MELYLLHACNMWLLSLNYCLICYFFAFVVFSYTVTREHTWKWVVPAHGTVSIKTSYRTYHLNSYRIRNRLKLGLMSQGSQNLSDWSQWQFAIKLSQNELKKCCMLYMAHTKHVVCTRTFIFTTLDNQNFLITFLTHACILGQLVYIKIVKCRVRARV